VQKKVGGLLLGGRGRLTSAVHRRKAIELIGEAMPLALVWFVPAARSVSACARSSAGGRPLPVMVEATIAVKAAYAWCCTNSARRSANESCLPATSPSTPHCHQLRSCQPLPIRGCTSAQRAASTGCSTPMDRCTVGVEHGHHRIRALYRGCVHRGRIRCGVRTSPICRPASVASGFTCIW
jgi:hypothetical protein